MKVWEVEVRGEVIFREASEENALAHTDKLVRDSDNDILVRIPAGLSSTTDAHTKVITRCLTCQTHICI